jgi:hypothetical protein
MIVMALLQQRSRKVALHILERDQKLILGGDALLGAE